MQYQYQAQSSQQPSYHHHGEMMMQQATPIACSTAPQVAAATSSSPQATVGPSTSSTLVMAITYNNVGAKHLEQGNIAASAEYLVHALQHVKRTLQQVRTYQQQQQRSGCSSGIITSAGIYSVEGTPSAAVVNNVPQQQQQLQQMQMMDGSEQQYHASFMYTQPSFLDARVVSPISSPSGCYYYGTVDDCNTVSMSILFNLALAHHVGAMLHHQEQQQQQSGSSSNNNIERDTCLYKARHFYESTYKLLSKSSSNSDTNTTTTCRRQEESHQQQDQSEEEQHDMFFTMNCTRYMSILNNLALCNVWLNRQEESSRCFQQLLSFTLYVQQVYNQTNNNENSSSNNDDESSSSSSSPCYLRFMDHVITRCLVMNSCNVAPAA